MSATQPIEQRQHGDMHALIRTIPTRNGDMPTVTLHREWLGQDGRTRRKGQRSRHAINGTVLPPTKSPNSK